MLRNFAPSLLATALSASSLSGQVLLENFATFASPNTLFFGEWSQSGDPFTGDPTPTSTFSPGSDYFNFASTTNGETGFAEYTFNTLVDIGSNFQLTLALRPLSDNTADGVTVSLIDQNFATAFATFQVSNLSVVSFTQQSVTFTADPGFASSAVRTFRISGNDPFATGVFSVAVQSLSVTGGSVSPPTLAPVPEPASYGLAAVGALIVVVGFSRRRRRSLV